MPSAGKIQEALMLTDFQPNRQLGYPQGWVWRQVSNLPNGQTGKLETYRHSRRVLEATAAISIPAGWSSCRGYGLGIAVERFL
jgi:hypothetical protein